MSRGDGLASYLRGASSGMVNSLLERSQSDAHDRFVFFSNTWEVNSCPDRQLRHEANSVVQVALDAKVLRRSSKTGF